MIRDATSDDAAQVAAIYAPYVRDTAISFEEEPPDVAEVAARIRAARAWIVLERDGAIVGYAYAGTFNRRAAYRWSVEASIYVDGAARRSGVGSALLDALLERLRADGCVNAFAGVTLPNAASVGLFESRGFAQVATYRNVGCKAGAWHDVGWWQLQLREPSLPPPPMDAAPS